MKKARAITGAALPLLVAAALAAAWFTASESTRRYLLHLGKQVPYLPYRYFI